MTELDIRDRFKAHPTTVLLPNVENWKVFHNHFLRFTFRYNVFKAKCRFCVLIQYKYTSTL